SSSGKVIAPSSNEIRYRVISHDSFLGGLLRPHLTLLPTPRAVETDKPPKTHRCSGRSGLTSSGVIPERSPIQGATPRMLLCRGCRRERILRRGDRPIAAQGVTDSSRPEARQRSRSRALSP